MNSDSVRPGCTEIEVSDGRVHGAGGEGDRMSEELKPCPFCGGEAHIAERITYGGKLYGACCYGTLCPGSEPFPWCLDYEDAADAWNRRAERTCHLIHEVEEEDDEFFDTVELHYYVCSECGRNNRLDAYYCDSCGAKVVER